MSVVTAKFTLAEYEAMVEAGAFEPLRGRRLEFLRGEIVEMSPIGSRHSEVVNRLMRWSVLLEQTFGFTTHCQQPIRIPLSDSVPEPDLAWTVARDYSDQHPGAADTLLVIEVADSSLDYDLGEKALVYAEAGITDYWVVNLREACVEVLREPTATGYGRRTVFAHDETLAPLAFPAATLTVSELFARRA
ncbi:MAG: Uma2 family endonuclease [Planctomycetota bacterium]